MKSTKNILTRQSNEFQKVLNKVRCLFKVADNDPVYCDVIVKRYKALGKEDIILERDGRLIQYEEIKELLI